MFAYSELSEVGGGVSCTVSNEARTPRLQQGVCSSPTENTRPTREAP